MWRPCLEKVKQNETKPKPKRIRTHWLGFTECEKVHVSMGCALPLVQKGSQAFTFQSKQTNESPPFGENFQNRGEVNVW